MINPENESNHQTGDVEPIVPKDQAEKSEDQSVAESEVWLAVERAAVGPTKIFDRSGQEIFSGTPDQLAIYIRNQDYGEPSNIGNIADSSGQTLIRFGAEDGRGFAGRHRIEPLLGAIELRVNRREQTAHDQARAQEILATLGVGGNQPAEKSTLEKNAMNPLSPEERNRLVQELWIVERDTYNQHQTSLQEEMFLVGQGFNVDGSKYEQVSPDIGRDYDAHGIAKSDQLTKLLHLLEQGVDPNLAFHTAPFELGNEERGAGGNTAGGTAHKDGLAVVTSGYRERIAENGIKHVFLNDVYGQLREPLQSLFPDVRIHLLSEQKAILEGEVKATSSAT
jgi:hypothetical protein